MFNAICPNVYQKLRERTDLNQAELGRAVGATRQSVCKFETGKGQMNKGQERKLLELAECSNEEFVELVCEELSDLIDKPVGIRRSQIGYEPTTALARAYALLRKPVSKLPMAMIRALNNRINTTRLMGLAFERNNADLVELTEDCYQELEEKRQGGDT